MILAWKTYLVKFTVSCLRSTNISLSYQLKSNYFVNAYIYVTTKGFVLKTTFQMEVCSNTSLEKWAGAFKTYIGNLSAGEQALMSLSFKAI